MVPAARHVHAGVREPNTSEDCVLVLKQSHHAVQATLRVMLCGKRGTWQCVLTCVATSSTVLSDHVTVLLLLLLEL